jgi:hypothetical protein
LLHNLCLIVGGVCLIVYLDDITLILSH